MLSKKAVSAVANAGKIHHRALSLSCPVNAEVIELAPISADIRKTLPARKITDLPQEKKDELYPKIGTREIVGPSFSATFDYFDTKQYPLPSVRWAKPTPEILALREKEKDSWQNLTLEEKKQLYRYSFRQTFAELNAPTGKWKRLTYIVFYTLFASLVVFVYNKESYGTNPNSYNQEYQNALVADQLFRNTGHVSGISSRYDFENNRWKDQK